MAEFTRERAGKIKKEELPLADDRFHITPEQIKQEHVAEEMPWPIVQKSGGEELPAVGGPEPAIAQREIFTNKSWLVGVEEELRDKDGDVQSDQSEQNDPRPLRPAPGGRRRFLA